MYQHVLLCGEKRKNARFAVAKRIVFFLPEKDYAMEENASKSWRDFGQEPETPGGMK